MQKHFDADLSKTQIVDLDLKGLPQNAHEEELKRIAGVKHIISASIDTHSITNTCTGTGRIKLRLGPNEDLDTVKLQYLKAGYGVAEHTENTKMKTNFTSDASLMTKSPIKAETNAKLSKISNLQSSGNDMFGNSTSVQQKYSVNVDIEGISQDKGAAQKESHAIQQWKGVSSR